MLYAKFGWNWLSGSGEEDKNVKSLRKLYNDNDGQRTNYDKKSSLEPSAQVSLNFIIQNHRANFKIEIKQKDTRTTIIL